MSTVETNLVQPSTGTTLTLGASGDTVDVPSGATLDVTGATVSGLSAGKVLQVVQGTHAVAVSTTGTVYVTTGLSASITPSSASNKVLVAGYINGFYSYGGAPTGAYMALYRGGAAIVAPAGWLYDASATGIQLSMPFNYLDSPSSTSSLTYEVYMKRHSGSTIVAQDGGPSYITLMEIEA
jgi:hypothetical protein